MSEERLIYSFVLNELLVKYYYHNRPSDYQDALERENENEKSLCKSLNRRLHLRQMEAAASKLDPKRRKRARSSSPPCSERQGWAIEREEPRQPKEIKTLFEPKDEMWFRNWMTQSWEQFTKGEHILDDPGLLGRHEELLEKMLRLETFTGSGYTNTSSDISLGIKKYAKLRAISSGTFFCLQLKEGFVS